MSIALVGWGMTETELLAPALQAVEKQMAAEATAGKRDWLVEGTRGSLNEIGATET